MLRTGALCTWTPSTLAAPAGLPTAPAGPKVPRPFKIRPSVTTSPVRAHRDIHHIYIGDHAIQSYCSSCYRDSVASITRVIVVVCQCTGRMFYLEDGAMRTECLALTVVFVYMPIAGASCRGKTHPGHD